MVKKGISFKNYMDKVFTKLYEELSKDKEIPYILNKI